MVILNITLSPHINVVSNVTSIDHIFEKVNPAMQALGLECVCLGGGKIEHNNQEKKLRVFGESTVSIAKFYPNQPIPNGIT